MALWQYKINEMPCELWNLRDQAVSAARCTERKKQLILIGFNRYLNCTCIFNTIGHCWTLLRHKDLIIVKYDFENSSSFCILCIQLNLHANKI